MKKIFLFAAATAVALSSCSKNEVYVNPADAANAIGFGSYLGANTKAVEETKFVATDVMSVMTYATGSNDFNAANATIIPFMTNVDVTKQADDSWKYENLKFWPKNDDDKLSFFAVSDASTTTRDFNKLASGIANFSYQNPQTAKYQVDLMAASELNLTNSGSTEVTNGKVKFTFKHILSQIKFSFKTAEDYGKDVVKLTKVTVDYDDTFYADANFSFDQAVESKGKWTTNNSVKQADETFDFTSAPKTLSETAIVDAIVPIMIVPQNAPLKLTVEYTVNQTDNGAVTTFSESFTSASLAPTAGYWQNTIYTYPVTISLDAIVFDEPTLTTWYNVDGGHDVAIN